MANINTPVTWDEHRRGWDVSMIGAMQERLHREHVISSEAACLFQKTMKWGRDYPFGAEEAYMLLDCWSIFVLRSNVPWTDYDKTMPASSFLPIIVASQPSVVLDYLRTRVHSRLSDRADHASWMAMATHLSEHLDVGTMAPEMEALVKTWSSNLRRDHNLATSLAAQAPYFPWLRMKQIHDKWAAYPGVQKAVAQWDGLVSAETIFLMGSQIAEAEHQDKLFAFEPPNDMFHAHNVKLPVARAHLKRRWRIESPGGVDKIDTSSVLHTISLVRSHVETHAEIETPNMCKAVAELCATIGGVDPCSNVLNLTNATLWGHLPEFQRDIGKYLAEYSRLGLDIPTEMFGILRCVDYPLSGHHQEKLLSEKATMYLLDYVVKGGNAMVTYQEVPALLRCLTGSTLLELQQSDVEAERQLFWMAIDESSCLRPDVRASVVQEAPIQQALLLLALIESHGVHQWGFLDDSKLVSADVMSAWYPQERERWQQVQREIVRNPKTAPQHLWEAVLQVQNIAPDKWSVIQDLVDSPEHNTNARQAFAHYRSWNLGLPQSAPTMAWVLETLGSTTPTLSLSLPDLGDQSLGI